MRRVPRLRTDEEAEAFLAQDLSDLDFGQFRAGQLEFERKDARLTMRLPQPMLEALKQQARARHSLPAPGPRGDPEGARGWRAGVRQIEHAGANVVIGTGSMDTGTVTRTVRAEWDAEARVWVAESDDVPGLVTEAETIERVIERLQVLVPELLELNGAVDDGGAIELVARLPERTHPDRPWATS